MSGGAYIVEPAGWVCRHGCGPEATREDAEAFCRRHCSIVGPGYDGRPVELRVDARVLLHGVRRPHVVVEVIPALGVFRHREEGCAAGTIASEARTESVREVLS